MSLMSSLYVGTSGLQTSQNALNTVAHNLSNVDTVGYTRQQVQQSDKPYVTISKTGSAVAYQQLGLGTAYSRVKQVRDYFLDKAYRKEVGREGFYETSTHVFEEIENQLGELTGEAFQTNITDLWSSVQELSKDPSSTVTQGLLVQRATEFVERANAVYAGLASYQDNLNAQVKQQVGIINDYGKQIMALNDVIRTIESGNVEQANDYKDTRNRLLDELSQKTDLTWSEDPYGNVSVKIEGVDFVKGSTLYEIGLDVDETTGFYTPYWPQNASYVVMEDGSRFYNTDGAEVFHFDREISSDLGTDIGSLKAMLWARGDHRANYGDVERNYNSISNSIIMNIQGEFDQMVHNMTTKINDILATAAGQVRGDLALADGTTLQNVAYVEADPTAYLRKSDGSPIQMFSKVTTDSYNKVTGADGKEYFVYAEEDLDKEDTMYTLNNTRVDMELMQNPSMLKFIRDDGSADIETANKLKEAFSEEVYTLNPNIQKRTNFIDYYSDLVAQVANNGYVFHGIHENQMTTVEHTETARDQILAVSSDEELSNMIKLQNAYNASSRYITTVSQMLEHVIQSLFS